MGVKRLGTDENTTEHTLNVGRIKEATPTGFIDYLFMLALSKGASDIHLEIGKSHDSQKLESSVVVRLRIDGVLVELNMREFREVRYREIISRLKYLAGMDTTQNRIPQDGNVRVKTPQGRAMLRVSTIPALSHEEVVIRLQKGASQIHKLGDLVMTSKMKKQLASVLSQKSGLIILNGPTGSGKTTTIYAMLDYLASKEKKIVTAEDPVEMELPWVNHYQINPQVSFATLARSFMRLDSDVILIGEVQIGRAHV